MHVHEPEEKHHLLRARLVFSETMATQRHLDNVFSVGYYHRTWSHQGLQQTNVYSLNYMSTNNDTCMLIKSVIIAN